MEMRIKRFSFESLARKYYRSSKKVKGEILDLTRYTRCTLHYCISTFVYCSRYDRYDVSQSADLPCALTLDRSSEAPL